ncbi:MAG TPA: AAA family ATPase, partial [Oscillatoriaceae cyanobacterium]
MPLISDRFTPLRPLGSHLLLVQDRDATPRVLKRLSDPSHADPAAVLRLRLEAWRASQLEGPRFARAYWEPFKTDEPAYYLMSYAEGVPATLVAPAELQTVVRELLEALLLLHAKGWVHASLEPQLLRRTDSGLVVVGYGNLTPIGQAAWRPGQADYQSPEQAAGLPLDGRADLFSLGALIHFWMTGEPHTARLLDASEEPLGRLALALLATDPGDRPADAQSVLAQLGETLPATPPALVAPRLPRTRVLAPIAEALGQGHGLARRLEGSAGAGRSTLLKLASALAEAADWPVARATAHAGALPLAPWQALVASLEPLARTRSPGLLERLQFRLAPWRHSHDEGLAIPEATAVRTRFWDALAEFLSAIAEPGLVLLLDDWDQADEASRATLQAVQSRLREAPILWLVAGEHLALEVPPLALPPLTQDEGVTLVRSALAGRLAEPDAQGLHLVAEGQPWFLLNLVAYLREAEMLRWNGESWSLRAPASWPVTPEALARLRLATLPSAAWQAGMACALLAEPIKAQPLMLVLPELDTLVAGLDSLLRAGVLRQGEGFAFAHPTYREIFREALPPQERP